MPSQFFRKNVKALKELNELVVELAETCTYAPAGFDKRGIRQHILDTLNERRQRIHKGHNYYEKVHCFKCLPLRMALLIAFYVYLINTNC